MIAKQTMSLHIAPVPVWKMVQLFFLYIDPVKFISFQLRSLFNSLP